MLGEFNLALIKELKGRLMEVGDEFVFTCNNATVIYEMCENREMKVRIIGGEAIHIDTSLDIFN